MAIETCTRCGRWVDLDWHVEDIEYINNEPICVSCLTEEELEWIEANEPR